jgi:hypothetical protein
MIQTVLTKEEQDFAAENHGLIYTFLNKNKLIDDDCLCPHSVAAK